MFSRFHRRFYFALGLSTLMFAQSVQAQSWLEDRTRTEGHGVRTGNFELHPGVGAEVGYDTNNFLASSNPEATALLRVTPHITISTLTQERRQGGNEGDANTNTASTLRFRGSASASYYHFFLASARDNVSGDLSANLQINPDHPVSFTLNEQFVRTIRPFAPQTGSESISFGRNQNIVSGQLQLSTPGNLFQGRIGYDFNYNFFDGRQYQGSNSMQHTARLGSSLRFLPQTALIYDFAYDFQTFPNAAESSSLLSDSSRLQTRLGLNGAITNKFSMMALFGYSAGFFSRGDDFEAFVGQVEGRFQLTESSKIAFGYDRSVFGSYIGNFYRQDRFYANASLTLIGKILLGVDVSAALLSFGVPISANGVTPLGYNSDDMNDPSRRDTRFVASLFGEYRFTDFLAANATIRYTGDYTTFQYVSTEMSATTIEPAGYSKFEAWLGVRYFY